MTSLAWYHGFIPIASGQQRCGMRNALDLKILPPSIKINASGSESWTDYIFEVDFSITPEQFDKLLVGRDFKVSSDRGVTQAFRIKNYSGFKTDRKWTWSHKPPNLREYDHGAQCTLYANKMRDRVFIRFTSD